MVPGPHPNPVPFYLGTIVGEWWLLWFVSRGMRSAGHEPLEPLTRHISVTSVIADVVLGIPIGLGMVWLDAFVQHAIPSPGSHLVDPLLPRGPLEVVCWVAVSVSAGVAEELVYRGYLMRELETRLRSLPAAVVVQGLWFGVMHAYEGATSVVSIAVIGISFGIIAVLRKQLRANVVAHACIDLVQGLAPSLIHY